MANLKRYRKLQALLIQIELALTVTNEEIARLEQQALSERHVFVRTACGEWEIKDVTEQEQAILLESAEKGEMCNAKKGPRGECDPDDLRQRRRDNHY